MRKRFLLVLVFVGLVAGHRALATPVAPSTDSPTASATTPSDLQSYTLAPDKLAKARTLGRIRPLLHFGGTLWGLAVLWLLLATRTAARLEAWVHRRTSSRWLQGVIFFPILILLLNLLDLPLSLLGHTISLHYGISVQSWSGWIVDLSKSLGLSLVGGTLVFLLFHWVVRIAPRRYWLCAWAITLPLMVLGAVGEPLLEPVFNTFEPLSKSNPALVAKLEKLVDRTGTHIPPERIFLMRASVKTNALNAYVSGLGATKRVVVWDTTAGRIADDEILFIFGHESGHYVLRHILKGLLLAAIFLLPFYWLCAKAAEWLARRKADAWGVAGLESRAGFVLLLLVVSVAQFVLEPLDNVVSRYFEHQADVYGQESIHGLVADPQQTAARAFVHLGESILDDPDPNPLVEFWSYSHPSIQHRVQFATRYNPWNGSARPEFFQ